MQLPLVQKISFCLGLLCKKALKFWGTYLPLTPHTGVEESMFVLHSCVMILIFILSV